MSVHGVQFRSGRAKHYASPQRSDFGLAPDRLRSEKVVPDNQSVRTTKTGQILHEINPNLRRTAKTTKSDFRLADSRFNDSMEQDGSLANFHSQRPSIRKGSAKSRTELAEFVQIAMLEDLVQRKEELVSQLDSNEDSIERKIADLTNKKHAIRDEQNTLLKELEDLGLKLKDFDNDTGVNLRNCTILSPFLVRCSQQAVNKLKGVTQNLSNKETKAEMQRAIQSIDSAKHNREELIVQILSLDTDTLREREAMYQEDKTGRLLQRQDLVERLESLGQQIYFLEGGLEEERQYEKRFEDLRQQKEFAAQESIMAGETLTYVLVKKSKLEEDVRRLHEGIAKNSHERGVVSRELTHFMEEYYEKFGSRISEDSRLCAELMSDHRELTDNIFEELRLLEINKHVDWSINQLTDIEFVREMYTSTLQVAGRILCMIGRNNVETAIQSFVQEVVGHEKNEYTEQVCRSCLAVMQHLDAFVSTKFESSKEDGDKFEGVQEILKGFVSLQLKTTGVFYDMYIKKVNLSSDIQMMMAEAQQKETLLLEMNREKTRLIFSIPQLRNQNKQYNFQFSKLVFDQETKLSSFVDDEVKEDRESRGMDLFENSVLNQSLNQSMLEQSNLFMDEQVITQPQIVVEPGRRIEIGEEKLEQKREEQNLCQLRLKDLQGLVAELQDHMQQTDIERGNMNDRVKELRKGLVEVLQKEAREFGVISSLFDYISRPVLSRDIGISVLDNLQSDLNNVVQQIMSEINRQKRIIKLVNRHEDYSHEEKIFDSMLNANICKIKSELSKLNEEQIPELRKIENVVTQTEAHNMEMKDQLNEVLDSIELNEQTLLEQLEAEVARGLTRLQVSKLFSK